jgi:hypothetical protein
MSEPNKSKRSRYAYTKFDEKSLKTQSVILKEIEALTESVEKLAVSRPQMLVLTKLEEAYMWVGKAIRDDQIDRETTKG